MDVAFVDKKVATEPMLAAKFNTELTVLYSDPPTATDVLPWLDGNNNPVGVMIDADGSPQFLDVYIPYGTFEITVHAHSQNTVASVYEWRAEVAQDPDFATPGTFTQVLGSSVRGAFPGALPIGNTNQSTFLVTNPSREILSDNPASEFQKYKTLCRLRVVAVASSLFSAPIVEERYHTMIIRRLPTIGPVGLDSGSASESDLIGSSLRLLAMSGHPAIDLKSEKLRPDACAEERRFRTRTAQEYVANSRLRKAHTMLDNPCR
jgi:hypothetical protein